MLTLATALACAAPILAEITFLPVPAASSFPDATVKDALQYACADSESDLASFFRQRGLRFSPSLVTRRGDYSACHIHYAPTVPGYRALPDNRPIQSLFIAVDPMSFLVMNKPVGDSLSIAKDVLSQIDRPLDVTISVAGGFDRSFWPAALQFHFGGTKHRLDVHQSGAQSAHVWAQDHQKAGQVNGKLRILVPRRLFEGRREDGEAFGPMLDKLSDPKFGRSKLSWEGGDLQFIRDPRSPSRLLLVHGGVGRYYWGAELTPAETSHVLLTELGADAAIDLTETGLHADFVVAFLPEEGVALVSESVRNDPQLARAAAEVLARLFGKTPPPALLDLQRFLAGWDGDLEKSAGALRGLIRGLEKAFASNPYPEDPNLEAELTAYVAAHCGGDPSTCFQAEGKNRMLALTPDLLRRSSEQSVDIGLFEFATPRMLAIIEGQLPRAATLRERAMDEAALAMEQRGFRVVRIPYLYAPKLEASWAGIAYVNSFVYGRKIFVPALGLGGFESKVFADMQKRIGPQYQVIPISAWSALLNNGGAHCVFGIVREPERVRRLSE